MSLNEEIEKLKGLEFLYINKFNCVVVDATYNKNIILNLKLENGEVKKLSANQAIECGRLRFISSSEENLFYKVNDNLKKIFQTELETKKEVRKKENLEISNSHEKILDNGEYEYFLTIKNLSNKVLNKKGIALELISLYGNSKFEKELYDIGFEILLNSKKNVDTISHESSSYVIVMTSYIALKYYNADLHTRIYERFCETFPEKEKYITKNELITQYLYPMLNWYRPIVKYFFDNSYVAVPLVMSCVPEYRVSDLFKFSLDIYKKKLLYDEEIDDDEIKDKVLEVYNVLKRKDLIGNNDELKIKGSEYLMSKYTQSCIYSGKNLEELASITTYCIRSIINYLTLNEDAYVIDDYYKNGFNYFVDFFNHDSSERDNYEKNKYISNPWIKFIDNDIYLYTGELAVSDECNPHNLCVEINNDNECVKKVFLNQIGDVVKSYDDDFSGYRINRKKIRLECNSLNKLSYVIKDGKEIVYDSKKKLYRENIFFDGKGVEVKPGSDYVGDIAVISRNSLDDIYEVKKEIVLSSELFYSIIEINKDEIYRFDNIPYVFHRLDDPQLLGYKVPWGEFINFEKKKFSIYKDLSFVFLASCDMENIVLEVDGIENSLYEPQNVEFGIHLFSRQRDGFNSYRLTIFNMESGYKHLKIINGKTKKVIKKCDFKILYDPTITRSFLGVINKTTKYSISSELLTDSFETYIEMGKSYNDSEVFCKSLGLGILRQYPSSVSYSIDGQDWRDIKETLYITEIPNNSNFIKVCGPSGLKSYLTEYQTNTIQPLGLSFEEDRPCIYDLNISELRKFSKETSAVKIYFSYLSEKKVYLLSFMHPTVEKEKSSFIRDKEGFKFKTSFKGAKEVQCVINVLHEDIQLYCSKIESDKEYCLLNEMIPDNTENLSVSLHVLRKNGLFSNYEKEPFYTYPKYSLKEEKIEKILEKYDDRNQKIKIWGKVKDDDELTLVLIPSGINLVAGHAKISGDFEIDFDISKKVFDSYNVLVFSNVNDKINVNEYIYKSKSIKVKSNYLHKIFKLKKYIYADGSIKTYNYTFASKRVVANGKKPWLQGDIIDYLGMIVCPNVVINIVINTEKIKSALIKKINKEKKFEDFIDLNTHKIVQAIELN